MALTKVLPCKGILRQVEDGWRFQVAGHRLTEGFLCDPMGKLFEDCVPPGQHSYWRRVHAGVAETNAPDCGIINSPKAHLIHFWLRLPLRPSNDQPEILTFDEFAFSSHVPAEFIELCELV